MPLSLNCPNCQKAYSVPDSLAGKQVRCQKCSHVFTVAAPPEPLRPVAIDPLAVAELPPLAGFGPALSVGQNPLGTLPPANPLGYAPLPASSFAPSYGGPQAPPLEGPTDAQFRWGSAAAIAIGIALVGLCVISYVVDQSVFLYPLLLAPLLILLGIAGLIEPNVVRAVGKYGKHLPLHYKLIAWGLMGVWLVVLVIIVIAMVQLGFRPGR